MKRFLNSPRFVAAVVGLGIMAMGVIPAIKQEPASIVPLIIGLIILAGAAGFARGERHN